MSKKAIYFKYEAIGIKELFGVKTEFDREYVDTLREAHQVIARFKDVWGEAKLYRLDEYTGLRLRELKA